MRSKIQIAGHPLHPMLIAFPVAFYTAALACYIAHRFNLDIFWYKVGVIANIAGVVMAAFAAIPGFIDWLYIPPAAGAKRVGLFHMICNVTALVCYGIVAFLACKKWDDPDATFGLAIPLTAIGFILTLIAGFLGWTLVQKHHIGVEDIPKN